MANKLLDKILKNSTTKYTSVLSESKMFNDKDRVSTGIPIVDIAFSGEIGGGITSGLTLLAGPSKSFKSLLALLCLKAFLEKYPDSIGVVYDSEGGMTPSYLKGIGIDSDRVVHIPIDHLEMLKFDIVKQLSEIDRGDKVMFIIDSIGNTASLKELTDALDEKTVAEMQRAKTIKGLFRMVTPSLVNKDISCIAICHTYDELGMFPKQMISGGCLAPGHKIIMADGTLKNIENVIEGDIVRTLIGDREVVNVWDKHTLENGNPECYSVEFDDGTTVICSDSHKFLDENFKWKKITEFNDGDWVVSRD